MSPEVQKLISALEAALPQLREEEVRACEKAERINDREPNDTFSQEWNKWESRYAIAEEASWQASENTKHAETLLEDLQEEQT